MSSTRHAVYGDGSDTPWVFTFCGTEAYSGLRRLVNAPGTDGTVRWAGCSLTCRKVDMDLTKPSTERRVLFDPWKQSPHRLSSSKASPTPRS